MNNPLLIFCFIWENKASVALFTQRFIFHSKAAISKRHRDSSKAKGANVGGVDTFFFDIAVY
jgi:hypothetical protein